MKASPLLFRVIALQFLVGALVTFGGASFAAFAFNHFGTALGLIHLSIGAVGLSTGFLMLRRKALPWRFLLAINVITIGYSASSEGLVFVESLLPPFASVGSLVGTVIAVIMSCAIVFLLSRPDRAAFRK